MEPTRQEMIDVICRWHGGNAAEASVRQLMNNETADNLKVRYQAALKNREMQIASVRQKISSDPSVQQAESEAREAQQAAAEALRDYWFTKLCMHDFGGMSLANVQANKTIVFGWSQDTQPSPALLQRIFDENPATKRQLAWVKHESAAEQQQHSAQQDENTRQVMLGVCRRYNISFSQANQSGVLSAFPNGLADANELETAIESGALQLHPADASEVEQFTRDLVKAHNLFWSKQSVAYLKEHSQLEREQRRQIFDRVTPAPARSVGVEPLPATITREVLLEKLNSDRAAIHLWSDRYGIRAVNDRLNNLS